MSIDMYSEKTIEATMLIKQVTGLDWFYALDTNSQETLERFIACMDKVKADILASLPSTALQAPVREVPEPEPDMLWEADEPEDGVTGNSPKDFAENYASAAVGRGETHDVEVLCCNRTHNRTMRVSVSADEDAENWLHWEWVAPLPADPVQKEGE